MYNTNGLLSATNAIAHTPDSFGIGWEIGNDDCCGTGRAYNGMIDELAVFTNTLSQQQIFNLWAAGDVAGAGMAGSAFVLSCAIRAAPAITPRTVKQIVFIMSKVKF